MVDEPTPEIARLNEEYEWHFERIERARQEFIAVPWWRYFRREAAADRYKTALFAGALWQISNAGYVPEPPYPPVERLPDYVPWPRKECGNRGPRVARGGTICCRSKGHAGPHRTAPSDGHGNVEWPSYPPVPPDAGGRDE